MTRPPNANVPVAGLDIQTLDAFPPEGDARQAWDDLVTADPHGTVFHTVGFLATWYRALAVATPRLRLFHDGPKLVGIVPEVRRTIATALGPREAIAFAGGPHVTDYRGPVAAPDDRAAVAAAWIAALEDEDDWDEVILGGLTDDGGWDDLLAHNARDAGWRVFVEVPDVVCPRVDLTGGWDAYLERLPGKQRHEMRRKTRKFATEARGAVSLVEVAPDEVVDAMARFVATASDSPDPDKRRFFEEAGMRGFFAALAEDLGGTTPTGDRPLLRVHELRVGEAVAASAVSFVFGREWGLYNSAFDRTWAPLGPGMVLVSELLAAAAREGVDVFDFLRGAEAYKYRFGAVDRHLRRVTMSRGVR